MRNRGDSLFNKRFGMFDCDLSRETQRDRDRETDRDRKTERQTNRQRQRQRDRERDNEKEKKRNTLVGWPLITRYYCGELGRFDRDVNSVGYRYRCS